MWPFWHAYISTDVLFCSAVSSASRASSRTMLRATQASVRRTYEVLILDVGLAFEEKLRRLEVAFKRSEREGVVSELASKGGRPGLCF